MNYIYDISVNLNDEYLDFFEWNSQDKIITISKAPLFKVDNKTFNDLLCNDIKLKDETIGKVLKKSFEYYLIMNNKNIIVIKFDSQGNNKLKSSLLVTDELDIVENFKGIKEISLDYIVINKKKFSFQTRNEKEMVKYLSKEIKKIRLPIDNDKINYLYLECFGQKAIDSYYALSMIKKSIKNNFKTSKIYKIFKLIEQK